MSDESETAAPFDALAAQREISRRRAARREMAPTAGATAPRGQQRRIAASSWDSALANVLKRQGGNES
uniref:Uncharacterized protein n=1 Tax=Bosea sp. NBC_00436 TaxID=2969620 RepID=A0A9E7ZX36_9HYPH